MQFKVVATATLGFLLSIGPTLAQTPDDPIVAACKATGLLALQAKASDVTDLVFDMDTLAISAANTRIENIQVTTVVLGEAYINRKEKTVNPDRFVCLLGEKGKVLLFFFTAR